MAELSGQDRRVIACNLLDGTSHSRAGALAYVQFPNPGSGGERVGLILRSRSGRWIEIWQPAKRLKNFRFKTLPPEHPRYVDARISDWCDERDLAMLQAAVERSHLPSEADAMK